LPGSLNINPGDFQAWARQLNKQRHESTFLKTAGEVSRHFLTYHNSVLPLLG
jgi:hypothetical protein